MKGQVTNNESEPKCNKHIVGDGVRGFHQIKVSQCAPSRREKFKSYREEAV